MLLLLVFWYAHHRVQPYCFDDQNKLESILFAAATSIMLLAPLIKFTPSGGGVAGAVAVLMAIILLLALIASVYALSTQCSCFKGNEDDSKRGIFRSDDSSPLLFNFCLCKILNFKCYLIWRLSNRGT